MNLLKKIKEFFQKKQISIVATVLLVVIFFAFGVFMGDFNRPEIDKVTGLSGKETAVTTDADFSPFWKVWNVMSDKSLTVNTITDQDRVYGAIQGLIGSLNDPYSEFFPPNDAKSFEDEIAGSFDGIGMEVGVKNGVLTVIAPLKDTPAFNAGIKAGDEILKIGSTVTTNLNIDDAINMIRGPKGTSVTLTILHEGSQQPQNISIVRDTINIPTLDTIARPDGIFVIKLYSFDANSASLFSNAINQFDASHDTKLLLDLRGNPGGYLDAAVDIASYFLPEGKTIVTEDYGAKQPSDVFRSKGYGGIDSNDKVVVLIDGGSASASEILSGALQDNGRAKLVGAQSFGKGSVQEVVNVTPDTILKITIARWLTPDGTSISEKGLTPDYPVTITQKDINAQKDPQMDKAVQLLNN